MNSQASGRKQPNRSGKGLLAKAGQMSLASSGASYSPHKLMQEIGNDDDFMPLTNVTTTYVERTDAEIIKDNPVVNSKIADNSTSNELLSNIRDRQQVPHRASQSTGKFNTKAKLEVNESQYDSIMSKIRKTGHQSQISRKKPVKKLKLEDDGENELDGVEHIIKEIQQVMDNSINAAGRSAFKNSVKLVHHTDKKNWQSKGIHKFNEGNGISKLQELLLHYNLDDRDEIFAQSKKEPVRQQAKPNRKNRNQERMNRIKDYNELSKSIADSEIVEKKTNYAEKLERGAKQMNQLKQLKQQSQNQFPKIENNRNKVKMQNIELIEIDWMKLPIILNELNQQNGQIYLKMRDFPQDESFIESIQECMKSETKFKTYSIFNSQHHAGMKKSKVLMAEEQFRQIWAEEWQYDIDEEETKELLCQLDFQWYRSLVQFTYNHSLEEILMKNIKYDYQLYQKNLVKINGQGNDKNIDNKTYLPDKINRNKLKFIEFMLTKLVRDKQMRINEICLMIAIVPNIGESQTQQSFAHLKNDIQQIFKGGLYSMQSETSSMGVIITQQQAARAKIEKQSNKNIVSIDKSVDLLINQQVNQSFMKNKIVLKREKTKNSNIRITLIRQGQQNMELQVGEELHFGRRYHILFD